MTDLRFGILGLSEGNGHPFSWSAIFNGYDPEAMAECPFPGIPAYLAKQRFPQDALPGGRVTHVWTQDPALSAQVARAARIENVVASYADMIGHVDAILLARDDADRHLEMSTPFLEAGLPVFIDKPLATSVAEMERILAKQRYDGQVFSCTALRYAKEFQLTQTERQAMGTLRFVDACVMKSWETYGIHVVEPLLELIGDQGELEVVSRTVSGGITEVQLAFSSGLVALVHAMGSTSSPISIRLFGEQGHRVLTFEDTFFAFKEALRAFVRGIETRQPQITPAMMRRVVNVIERGIHGR